MPDPSPSTPTHPEIRYDLRRLLLTTTALAILAAVAGPVYRQAVPEARSSLLAMWTGALGVVTAYLLMRWRAHARRTYFAGSVRYRLARPDVPRHLLRWALIPWSALLAYSTATIVAISYSASRSSLQPPLAMGAFAGGLLGFLFIAAAHFLYQPLVRKQPIAMCEDGVIIANRVIPWTSVVRTWQHHLYPSWLMLSTWTRSYAAEVPAHLHEEIEAFVREKTAFTLFDDDDQLTPGQ